MTESNNDDRCPACWKLVEEEIAEASRSHEEDLVEYFPDFRRIKCDECKAKDPQGSELEEGPVITPEMRAIRERLQEISRDRIKMTKALLDAPETVHRHPRPKPGQEQWFDKPE